MKPSLLASILVLLATRTPAQQAHTVMEREPNSTPAQAKVVALGDTIAGTVASVSDVDFFAVDIPAGTFLRLDYGPRLCILDRDGVTLLDCNSEDYPAAFPLTTAGRYYIRLDGTAVHTGEPIIGAYRVPVQAKPFSLAPGDPTRTVIDLPLPPPAMPYVRQIWHLAAGLSGELYVGIRERILRVDSDGDTTTVASGVIVEGSMVVDPFGDLVFAGWDGAPPLTLWKLSPTGQLSRFSTGAAGLSGETALAVGPGGDLWVGTGSGITRLDPTGFKKAEIPLKPAYDLAAGPSGELYVAGAFGPCFNGAYVVRGTNIDCILPSIDFEINYPQVELAIDSYGNLFVGKHQEDDFGPGAVEDYGRVDWYAPGSTERRLHAHVPRLQELTFARDVQGNMTSRLYAIDWRGKPKLVELNGANDRAAGAGFKVRFFHAMLDSLPIATFGAAYNQTLHVTTDATSLTWTVENGTLPPGLTLSTDGVVKGVPAALGSYEFTVRATSGLRSWFAPGTISVRGDLVDVSSIVAALLGGPALSPTQVQLLDQIGNKNGILDTGDLRAYLRSQSRLP